MLTKYITRILIITLMIFLIALACIRYRADVHFNHAMKLKYQRRIDDHIVWARRAARLNPFILNYTNVLGMTYLQTAIKSIQTGNDLQETAKWLVNTIYTAEKVQKRYPGEYWSARMLLESYIGLNSLSSIDMFDQIEKYHKIVISAKPYSEEVK